jgi:hypothetical protein
MVKSKSTGAARHQFVMMPEGTAVVIEDILVSMFSSDTGIVAIYCVLESILESFGDNGVLRFAPEATLREDIWFLLSRLPWSSRSEGS